MAKSKRLKPAPAVNLKRSAGETALNPMGLTQDGSPMFIDVTVARDHYEQNSEWDRWSDDEKAQVRFSQPVRSRLNG